jgi:glycogen(starch) synthase
VKIGLIVPGFSADERDWCIPAHLNLARSFALSHHVHVFALRYPHRRDVYPVRGVTVHSFNGEGSRGLESAHLWATALDAILGEHRTLPFDVLHSIFGGEAGFVTVLAARRLGVPSVVSLVGGELVGMPDIGYGQALKWRQRMLNQIALRFADRLLGGSRGMTELARTQVPANRRERIQTLPLGVDTLMFSPAPVSPPRHGNGENDQPFSPFSKGGVKGSVNILNVGSLIEVKDHATLLHATAKLAQELPNVCLSIIGAGRLESQLRALASNLEIADRVCFVGAVAHDQLPEWYRRTDLFVQSSRHEGEGMAVLEAGASGVPIAGTDVGVLSDLAVCGAAIAVPPGDANALARGMYSALASRAALGTQVLEFVEREYNLENIGERLVELYCSISKLKGAHHLAQPLSRP